METRKFTVNVIKSPEGGYTGQCLELPAAISEGDTLEELKTNMKDVIPLILKTINEKSKPDQKIIIEIPN